MAKISTNAEINSVRLAEQASAPDTPASGYGQLYCKSDGLYFKGDDGVEIGPLAAAASGYTEGARVYHSIDQTLSNNLGAQLAFDSEIYDTDNIHDNTTNNSRLTCKTAGKYIISASVVWEAFVGAANAVVQITIRLNGTTNISSIKTPHSGAASVSIIQNVTTVFDLDVNDYIEVRAYQNSGGDLDVLAASNNSAEFTIQRVG